MAEAQVSLMIGIQRNANGTFPGVLRDGKAIVRAAATYR